MNSLILEIFLSAMSSEIGSYDRATRHHVTLFIMYSIECTVTRIFADYKTLCAKWGNDMLYDEFDQHTSSPVSVALTVEKAI